MRSIRTDKMSFNSLQTGKPIQRHHARSLCLLGRKFQFPANGKAYPKALGIDLIQGAGILFVSIPFKRESLSKGGTSTRYTSNGFVEFPFPSNGKAYPKLFRHVRCGVGFHVSIPCKRESLSKEEQPLYMYH